MKKISLILGTVLSLTFTLNLQIVNAQKHSNIDSLLHRLATAIEDSNKVNLLTDLGITNRRSNPEKSLEYANKALKLAENLGFEKGIAISYKIMGDFNIDKRDNEKAFEYYLKSLKISQKIGFKEYASKCLTNIGVVYYNRINYRKAIEYWEKSLKVKEEIMDKKGSSALYHNIGYVYSEQSNYIEAIKYFEKSLKICKKINNRLGIFKELNSTGLMYDNLGNKSKAMGYFREALKIAEDINYKNGVLSVYNNIGNILIDNHDYFKAMEYLKKALRIANEIGQKRSIAGCLNSLGIINYHLDNYSMADKYWSKSLKIEKELDNKISIANVLGNFAVLYKNKGDYSKALEYYSKALKIKEELNNRERISISLANIGGLYEEQGEYNKALKYCLKALKITEEIGYKEGNIRNLNALGNIYYLKKEQQNALLYYQKSLILNVSGFSDSSIYTNPTVLSAIVKPELIETLSNKAHALYLLSKKENPVGNLETSILTYDLLFSLVYQLRNDYSHENTNLILSENTKSYFANAVNVAIDYANFKTDSKSKEIVFNYIEKSKSTTLGAHLNDSKLKQLSNLPDSLLKKEKDIVIYRRFYKTAIQKAKAKKEGHDTLLIQNYEDKLFKFSRQYDSLVDIFKNDYPSYYSLKYKQEVASVENIQNQLDNNSALVNYFVSDTTLYIALITKDSLIYKVVKTDSLFKQSIFDYHIDIKSVFTGDELKTSTELYQTLISPIEGLIKNKDNLIIIPDEHLYYMPFETLCKNSSTSDNLTNADFLIKNYSVNYHHSATLWLNSIEKSQKQIDKNDNFIGFAPVFDAKANNGFIVSREWISDTTNMELATRSVSSDLNKFNSLPYSKEEVESIVKLFGKKGKKAKGFFYKEANEENFKQNVQNYNYIHIASHSFANDNFPALSGIAFSQPDSAKTEKQLDNGILYAGETYNLNIPNAELVVLSSCQSGLGKLAKGEGFLSLSRGFLFSGTPNIIFSLWNVKDKQSKDLMIEFYKNVLKGKNYSKALREAKLKLIKNMKTIEPKYWAPWILLGK